MVDEKQFAQDFLNLLDVFGGLGNSALEIMLMMQLKQLKKPIEEITIGELIEAKIDAENNCTLFTKRRPKN